jgi:hypothetical protein
MRPQVNIENQVEWNMAQLLTFELAKLRSEANSAFVQGNYKKAVKSLMAIKHSSVHVIPDDKREEFNEMEDKLIYYSKILSLNFGFNSKPKFYNNVQKKFEKLYRKYNEKIQDVLDEFGFLGDRKKDASRMPV